jgi:hypothetical protein
LILVLGQRQNDHDDMITSRGTTTLRGRRRPPEPLRPSNDNGNEEEEEEDDDDDLPMDEVDQELLVQDLERRIELQQVSASNSAGRRVASTHLSLKETSRCCLCCMEGANSFGLSGSLSFRRRCRPSHGGDRSGDRNK